MIKSIAAVKPLTIASLMLPTVLVIPFNILLNVSDIKDAIASRTPDKKLDILFQILSHIVVIRPNTVAITVYKAPVAAWIIPIIISHNPEKISFIACHAPLQLP